MTAAIVLSIGSAIVLLFGRRPGKRAPATETNQRVTGRALDEAIGDICYDLAAMTRDRNSWRERAQVALHVAGPVPPPAPVARITYCPGCECAECRHVRGR